ncbi:MAG TPA: hypothetical protein EYP56_15425, partial [Planctomycetaceae bacterium]|nr:hypothetical protein [Planctomycetaceae bacterium]
AADAFGRVRRVLIWAKFQVGVARPIGGDLQMDAVPAPAGSAPPIPPTIAPNGATLTGASPTHTPRNQQPSPGR